MCARGLLLKYLTSLPYSFNSFNMWEADYREVLQPVNASPSPGPILALALALALDP